MSDTLIIDIENHRSRERIKDLGEVFTPEQYVQQMLALFDEKLWADEGVTFFEPSAGHGNIVLSIFQKRVGSFAKKYKKLKLETPILYSVANALNTLWAIDICPLNVDLTRKRILELVARTLIEAGHRIHQVKMRNFLAHILCAILWQIQENETLSAISPAPDAPRQASKTRLGKDWLRKNQHKPLEFKMDWCTYFKQEQSQNVMPLMFQRALRFIDASLVGGKIRGFEEFEFAKDTIQIFTCYKATGSQKTGAA